MSNGPDDVSRYLQDHVAGNPSASVELLPVLYGELRRLAAAYLRRERRDHTLQPTALVHEAFLRLVDQSRVDGRGRAHFMALAAQAMRRVLVNHAKARLAKKRGGDRRRVSLSEAGSELGRDPPDVLSLDSLLERLSSLHPRQGEVVQLRFFGGLAVDEIAQVLGVSPRTVKGDWRAARAWLLTKLDEAP